MVAISCSINAHGVELPVTRHFIPLGQYTSDEAADCFLMLSREQVKQNLCCGWEGHCTNLVSSRVLWQSKHCITVSGWGPAGLVDFERWAALGLCIGLLLDVGLCATPFVRGESCGELLGDVRLAVSSAPPVRRSLRASPPSSFEDRRFRLIKLFLRNPRVAFRVAGGRFGNLGSV